MDLKGFSGALLLCWSDRIIVRQVITNYFCIRKSRQASQESSMELFDATKQKWEDCWFLGGDLNEIKECSEKKGRPR